jgi:hypothetical protein
MCFTSSTSPPPAVRGARTDVAGAPGSVLAGRHASARLCGRLSHGELAQAGVERAKTVEAADLHASSWKAGTSTTMRRPLHPTIALPWSVHPPPMLGLPLLFCFKNMLLHYHLTDFLFRDVL